MAIQISKKFYKCLRSLAKHQVRTLVDSSSTKTKPNCIISCKRSSLDHYLHTTYGRLDTIPLASKGWAHPKSKGDYFVIHPRHKKIQEEMLPFKNLQLDPNLISVLERQNIKLATEFQANAFERFKLDKHLLLAAETGCGKTLAYLLPIIQQLLRNRSTVFNTPGALVLVPNRELAYQVGETSKILCETVGLRVKIVVGGQTKKIMMSPDFTEIDILVATPGAIAKLSTVGIYKLNRVLYTVLDEADTLLDDSFEERLTGIMKRVSQSKLVLVSATAPKSLPDILKPYEANMHHLFSANLHRPLSNITQKFMRMMKTSRPSYLLQIAKNNNHPMLIFTNRNQTSNWSAMFLRENGVKCSNINGDMNFAVRIQQWNDFIRGDTNILTCTDVASRGLDTTNVRHVLNYDFPQHSADYIHRVGRVGRRGGVSDGKVTNFVSGAHEITLVQQIELAVRTDQALLDVDGNITHIVQKRIRQNMKQNA